MLGLPKSTEYNKRIPKQKFYEKITVSSKMKHIFVEQIKAIYWRNKIAETTINLAPGENVKEIEVFEINLNSEPLDISVLKQMDKEIPYHILFLLEYDGKYQAWTTYKETAGSGNFAFKVGNYYHTDWMEKAELPLKIDGLNIDKVYENFVRQIAGEVLQTKNVDETLSESVDRSEKIKTLEKQSAMLEEKIRREKQFNRQIEMNTELKRLKRKLEELQ